MFRPCASWIVALHYTCICPGEIRSFGSRGSPLTSSQHQDCPKSVTANTPVLEIIPYCHCPLIRYFIEFWKVAPHFIPSTSSATPEEFVVIVTSWSLECHLLHVSVFLML